MPEECTLIAGSLVKTGLAFEMKDKLRVPNDRSFWASLLNEAAEDASGRENEQRWIEGEGESEAEGMGMIGLLLLSCFILYYILYSNTSLPTPATHLTHLNEDKDRHYCNLDLPHLDSYPLSTLTHTHPIAYSHHEVRRHTRCPATALMLNFSYLCTPISIPSCTHARMTVEFHLTALKRATSTTQSSSSATGWTWVHPYYSLAHCMS